MTGAPFRKPQAADASVPGRLVLTARIEFLPEATVTGCPGVAVGSRLAFDRRLALGAVVAFGTHPIAFRMGTAIGFTSVCRLAPVSPMVAGTGRRGGGVVVLAGKRALAPMRRRIGVQLVGMLQ